MIQIKRSEYPRYLQNFVMSDKGCKRTQSAKGKWYDELIGKEKAKSPKQKQIKLSERKEKSAVSRKIIFKDDNKQVKQSKNNNATVKETKGQKGQIKSVTGKDSRQDKLILEFDTGNKRIMDPCFRNVLRKELALEAKQKENQKTKKQNKIYNSKVQETEVKAGTSRDVAGNAQDGICLTVDGEIDEDLDYVDDVLGDEDFEVEVVSQQMIESSDVRSANPKNQRQSVASDGKQQQKIAEELSEEQLLKLPKVKNLFNQFWEEKLKFPKVKNLFNQFWEEKMKEIGGKGKACEKKIPENLAATNNSPLIKSPSDTTIYAPVLGRLTNVRQEQVVLPERVMGTVISKW